MEIFVHFFLILSGCQSFIYFWHFSRFYTNVNPRCAFKIHEIQDSTMTDAAGPDEKSQAPSTVQYKKR